MVLQSKYEIVDTINITWFDYNILPATILCSENQ